MEDYSPPRPRSPDHGFSPEGAFSSRKRYDWSKVWIFPPGGREAAAAELAESAARLLHCSADDLRLLRQARRRRLGGLCSKSVAAAQSAVATAVAVARDVKTEHQMRGQTYFFSASKEAESARRNRSRSPSPCVSEQARRRRRESSPAAIPKAPDQLSRRRESSPAAVPVPRARSPSPQVARQESRPIARSQSPAAARARSPAPASTPPAPRRARSQSPARPQTPTTIDPPRVHVSGRRRFSSTARPATAAAATPSAVPHESPAELKRQIDALTRDLEELKHRHRVALEHARTARG